MEEDGAGHIGFGGGDGGNGQNGHALELGVQGFAFEIEVGGLVANVGDVSDIEGVAGAAGRQEGGEKPEEPAQEGRPGTRASRGEGIDKSHGGRSPLSSFHHRVFAVFCRNGSASNPNLVPGCWKDRGGFPGGPGACGRRPG